MICLFPQIHKYAKDHSDIDDRKQVNNVIKTLFFGASEEEIAVTPDTFWTGYTAFDNKVGSYDADEFIWKSKDIRDDKKHFWHRNCSLPCTKVIGFVACRITSKFVGVGAEELSWNDIKTIKYGKRSAISSYVSEKHSIVYTSACIELSRPEQYHSSKQLNENCSSHTMNEEDDAFCHQF